MEIINLGCEFGSTRIKAILTDKNNQILAIGTHDWQNQLVNNLWTYSEEEIIHGLQECYSSLKKDYQNKTHQKLEKLTSLGFSAMMHGYIVLDKNDQLLVPFRTWRNTNTGEASQKLNELFSFNIPMRWSIAHLYQAILNDEPHVKDIAYITTLAGYIHYRLTGEKVLGIGDASGMFPIDTKSGTYHEKMIQQFDNLIKDKHYPWKIREILPKVLEAGSIAGQLTEEGARLLDISQTLKPGCLLCPPEGDAGTGMVATNSIVPGTGNVSAGTSVFAMVVLKNALKNYYPKIDVITTPHGKDVAMVHCNNCTSDINAWMSLFKEVLEVYGIKADNDFYTKMFMKSLSADINSGNLTNFNYFSGEPVTKCDLGKPLFIRESDGTLSLANFMRTQIFSSIASLAIGMNILKKEKIKIETMRGHGGFFKTPEVGGRFMSCAMNAPITILNNASEGGAWGIAILANYLNYATLSFEEYIKQVFKNTQYIMVQSTAEDRRSFNQYLQRYKKFIKIEKMAGKVKLTCSKN